MATAKYAASDSPIVLTLTPLEASYLKGYVQNYLGRDKTESQRHSEMRVSIFDYLYCLGV
jgi:hypothetical protein